jgi:flagellar basal-body rod protein FlgF
MLRGLYTAASGLVTQQRKHDAITNNIGNMNTPGFKQRQTVGRSFPEMLISMVRDQSGGQPGPSSIGKLHFGVMAEENIPVFQQGDLEETGNPFDFAILSDIQMPGVQFDAGGKAITATGERIYQPQAFFTVMAPDGGERYTRNGKFTLDPGGRLVTAEGFPVMNEQGQPVSLVTADEAGQPASIQVFPNGQVVNTVTGEQLAALRITRVDNPHLLVPEGYGMYRAFEGTGIGVRPIDPNNPEDRITVRQGHVERSNVDPTQAMVDMMSAVRAYEANQKVIQAYDRSLEKAVNEIGRV